MDKHILVFTTAGSKKEASKLSKGLVKKKLAYCVNTIPAVQSTYLWEDKLCIDDEFLLIIKTQGKKFTAVEAWILENHSYDVPEIIATPITHGSLDYLKCIDNWVD